MASSSQPLRAWVSQFSDPSRQRCFYHVMKYTLYCKVCCRTLAEVGAKNLLRPA